MATYREETHHYVTYVDADGKETRFKLTNEAWHYTSDGPAYLSANLTPCSRLTKLSDIPFNPTQKAEQVTNSYHIQDDKNAAIGGVKIAVETLEKTLLARQLEIERVTLEQDSLVAKQVRILDGKLMEAIQEDVLIEELEEHIPAHNGVLAKRVESIFDITGLDKIAELV